MLHVHQASLDLGCEHNQPARLLTLLSLFLLGEGPLHENPLTHTHTHTHRWVTGGAQVGSEWWRGLNETMLGFPLCYFWFCHEKGHRCLG